MIFDPLYLLLAIGVLVAVGIVSIAIIVAVLAATRRNNEGK